MVRSLAIFCRAVLTVCLAGSVVACASPAASTGARSETPPAASIRRAVQVAETSTFIDLDPSLACLAENWVLANVYETLTRFTVPGSKELAEGVLAERWEVSPDYLAWTFHLRSGVTFHDGSPLTAQAVKASIERNRKLNPCSGYLFDPVTAIETPDPATVIFRLKHPAPLDLLLASAYAAWIISPAALDKDREWFAGHDAGTGPYRITQAEPNQRVVVDRYDAYWGGWEPGSIDQVVFELVEDPAVVQQMMAAGKLDYAMSNALSADQMAELDGTEQVRMEVSPGVVNELILLNHLNPPTDDPLVRQALAYSFPYADVIAGTYLGRGRQATGAVPLTVWGHNPEPAAASYDPDRARQLLAQAGYGEGLELTLAYDPGQDVQAELWQAALAKIGVKLNLQRADWPVRWEAQKSDPAGAPQAYMISWYPDVLGPYSYLFNLFHSEDPPVFNLGFHNDPAFDALIDQGNRLSGSDREAAAAQFHAAGAMLTEAADAIFIQDMPDIHVVAEDLRGVVDYPAYYGVVFWHEVRR